MDARKKNELKEWLGRVHRQHMTEEQSQTMEACAAAHGLPAKLVGKMKGEDLA